MRIKINQKFITKNADGTENGYLVPFFNINEQFHDSDKLPQQAYLTVVNPDEIKGPHLHFIRTGCFTCIKGNVRIVVKQNDKYESFLSGESYNYLTVIVPTGIPAALQNIGKGDAFVINMPSPAWTPDMNDEYTADFSDFNFKDIIV